MTDRERDRPEFEGQEVFKGGGQPNPLVVIATLLLMAGIWVIAL